MDWNLPGNDSSVFATLKTHRAAIPMWRLWSTLFRNPSFKVHKLDQSNLKCHCSCYSVVFLSNRWMCLRRLLNGRSWSCKMPLAPAKSWVLEYWPSRFSGDLNGLQLDIVQKFSLYDNHCSHMWKRLVFARERQLCSLRHQFPLATQRFKCK